MNTYLSKLPNFARRNGFPENELREDLKNPGYRYGAAGSIEFMILKDGDTISVGDYLFKCIETPGHTSGHMCFYETN
jgi:glyoxylase-like metal-dependent hydrolase (beta-lactamase superfamily II)